MPRPRRQLRRHNWPAVSGMAASDARPRRAAYMQPRERRPRERCLQRTASRLSTWRSLVPFDERHEIELRAREAKTRRQISIAAASCGGIVTCGNRRSCQTRGDDLGAHQPVATEEVEVEIIRLPRVAERPRDHLSDLIRREPRPQHGNGIGLPNRMLGARENHAFAHRLDARARVTLRIGPRERREMFRDGGLAL